MLEKYGPKVRWLREGRREGLRVLARRLGITPSYLSDIEHGRRLPSSEVSDRIADAVGVDRDALYELAIAERVADWPERERRLTLAVLLISDNTTGTAGIDVERLARAIDREIHIDAEHGFPPQVDARYLANAIADHYEHDDPTPSLRSGAITQ